MGITVSERDLSPFIVESFLVIESQVRTLRKAEKQGPTNG